MGHRTDRRDVTPIFGNIVPHPNDGRISIFLIWMLPSTQYGLG